MWKQKWIVSTCEEKLETGAAERGLETFSSHHVRWKEHFLPVSAFCFSSVLSAASHLFTTKTPLKACSFTWNIPVQRGAPHGQKLVDSSKLFSLICCLSSLKKTLLSVHMVLTAVLWVWRQKRETSACTAAGDKVRIRQKQTLSPAEQTHYFFSLLSSLCFITTCRIKWPLRL